MSAALDPTSCTCFGLADRNGDIRPVLCLGHMEDHFKLTGVQAWRYARYFATESDAKDRADVLRRMYPPEGYGTVVKIGPVSRWWLVLGQWWSAD